MNDRWIFWRPTHRNEWNKMPRYLEITKLTKIQLYLDIGHERTAMLRTYQQQKRSRIRRSPCHSVMDEDYTKLNGLHLPEHFFRFYAFNGQLYHTVQSFISWSPKWEKGEREIMTSCSPNNKTSVPSLKVRQERQPQNPRHKCSPINEWVSFKERARDFMMRKTWKFMN